MYKSFFFLWMTLVLMALTLYSNKNSEVDYLASQLDSVGKTFFLIDTLTLEERAIFEKVEKLEENFYFTANVKRYYKVKNKAGWKKTF